MFPNGQKIYHITHIDNLAGIIKDKYLWSDDHRVRKSIRNQNIGIHEIKRRRLEEIKITCCSNRLVGEFVPFYFCPRSVMLFILHKGNLPDIVHRDGQTPILHLESDLKETLEWINAAEKQWAFSNANAGSRTTQFFNQLQNFSKIDWPSVKNMDFRDPLIREHKQAEFLVHESFPWNLIQRIGVYNEETKSRVESILSTTDSKLVEVKKDWYF